jgi:hypothetical protein
MIKRRSEGKNPDRILANFGMRLKCGGKEQEEQLERRIELEGKKKEAKKEEEDKGQ